METPKFNQPESPRDRISRLIELLQKVEEDYRNGHAPITRVAYITNHLQNLLFDALKADGRISADGEYKTYAVTDILAEEGRDILYSKLLSDHPVAHPEQSRETDENLTLATEQKDSLRTLITSLRPRLSADKIAAALEILESPDVTVEELTILKTTLLKAALESYL